MLLPCEMEDATVTKTKVDVTEVTSICKGVKAQHTESAHYYLMPSLAS